MADFQKDPSDLGALWVKTGAKGEYMTGEISGVSVVCFPVRKTHERSPSWRVLKSTPKDQRPARREDDAPF